MERETATLGDEMCRSCMTRVVRSSCAWSQRFYWRTWAIDRQYIAFCEANERQQISPILGMSTCKSTNEDIPMCINRSVSLQ
jgi:hypothetical protein